ncbi:hypothetical protein [Natronorubrum sp. FCH18a]|uniref:hypothetical protein n=1 Tax=Natronorubrum sp. FCH18a TaxID=3447018 RepID=UPI003F517778
MSDPNLTTHPMKIAELIGIGSLAGYIGGSMGQGLTLTGLGEVTLIFLYVTLISISTNYIHKRIRSRMKNDEEERIRYDWPPHRGS